MALVISAVTLIYWFAVPELSERMVFEWIVFGARLIASHLPRQQTNADHDKEQIKAELAETHHTSLRYVVQSSDDSGFYDCSVVYTQSYNPSISTAHLHSKPYQQTRKGGYKQYCQPTKARF